MRTLSKEDQEKITPQDGIRLLKEGNKRFIQNLKFNRNLLQQANETSDSQHPFAVIISCMDSRTSAELIFDQGLGDIFSIRIAGNIITDEILGSAEFGCKVVGAKVIVVLGHTNCGAIKGAINDVDLGHLKTITSKVQRCIPKSDSKHKALTSADQIEFVTKANVQTSIDDIRIKSKILAELEGQKKLAIVGGVYDVSTGIINFFD